MIVPERVSAMTKLAIMQEENGEEMTKLISYRRVDYMLTEGFRAFVAGSVCYIVGLILYFCYLWDDLNAFVADLDYMGFFWNLVLYYIVFVVIYITVCVLVAFWRHLQSQRLRYEYLTYLRTIRISYGSEQTAMNTRKDKKQTKTARRR